MVSSYLIVLISGEISYSNIKKALKTFSGVKRRFTVLHKSKDNLIIDDYAHHPIEIKETLKSLKEITNNQIISIITMSIDLFK